MLLHSFIYIDSIGTRFWGAFSKSPVLVPQKHLGPLCPTPAICLLFLQGTKKTTTQNAPFLPSSMKLNEKGSCWWWLLQSLGALQQLETSILDAQEGKGECSSHSSFCALREEHSGSTVAFLGIQQFTPQVLAMKQQSRRKPNCKWAGGGSSTAVSCLFEWLAWPSLASCLGASGTGSWAAMDSQPALTWATPNAGSAYPAPYNTTRYHAHKAE